MKEKVKTVLERHYEARVEEIHARLNDITDSFSRLHEGEKGVSNQKLLCDFLMAFLPEKYAIGSGFVIDWHGGQSKQTDIILYDRLFNPELFRYEGANFYPVEVVYAVIEVKTTLTSGEIKDAIEKISSIKSLLFEPMSLAHPVEGGLGFGRTTRPLGFVFAYRTNIRKMETLLTQFRYAYGNSPAEQHIDLVCVLNSGCLARLKDNKIGFIHHGLLTEGENGKPVEMVCRTKSANEIEVSGRRYPTVRIKGDNAIVDPVRNFLMFLDMFYRHLNTKFVPEVQNVLQLYIPEHLKKQLIFSVEEP